MARPYSLTTEFIYEIMAVGVVLITFLAGVLQSILVGPSNITESPTAAELALFIVNVVFILAIMIPFLILIRMKWIYIAGTRLARYLRRHANLSLWYTVSTVSIRHNVQESALPPSDEPDEKSVDDEELQAVHDAAKVRAKLEEKDKRSNRRKKKDEKFIEKILKDEESGVKENKSESKELSEKKKSKKKLDDSDNGAGSAASPRPVVVLVEEKEKMMPKKKKKKKTTKSKPKDPEDSYSPPDSLASSVSDEKPPPKKRKAVAEDSKYSSSPSVSDDDDDDDDDDASKKDVVEEKASTDSSSKGASEDKTDSSSSSSAKESLSKSSSSSSSSEESVERVDMPALELPVRRTPSEASSPILASSSSRFFSGEHSGRSRWAQRKQQQMQEEAGKGSADQGDK